MTHEMKAGREGERVRERGREREGETRVRRGWRAWTCFSPDSQPSADPLAPVVFPEEDWGVGGGGGVRSMREVRGGEPYFFSPPSL